MSGTLTTQKAISTSNFINSIGIDGEASATTAAQMAYLGIDHLRTDITSSQNLLAAGADGAKVDVIIPWYLNSITTSTLANTIASSIDPAASVVEAIEGPNEVNGDPDIFNGLSGPAAMEAIQQTLYGLVQSDPNLTNATKTTSVYDFSVLQGTTTGTYSGMSAYADYNNVHAYGWPGTPPSWILPYEVANNTIAGTKPTVITETGAETMPGSGVDQAMQARYDIEALLDAYQLGVTKTYLFDIQDWNTGSNVNNFSAYYGLYNADGTIKEAGTAIHNLTSILTAGTGAGNTVTTSGSLAYSLTGLPYYGNSELMQKSNGAFDLAVWNETSEWNGATNTEIAIPTNQVTLTLGTTFASISVYDPLQSSAPIQTVKDASSITVGLNSDPLIIEAVPQDTLTVEVSESANQPDAQFQITVDGKVVGGVQTVHALSAGGVSQDVNLTGDWGVGAHTIGISPVSNASGSSTAAASNFFVTDLKYDGNLLVGSQASFTSSATQTFTTVGSVPNATSPLSDTVTVALSEDAYQGDAQFVLVVDGKAVTTAQSVTALHSSGLLQDFTFGLNLKSGYHTIGVDYLNDAYGGSSTQDRNLYIGSIQVNGQTAGATNVAMYWGGTYQAGYVK